jgi:hypothetical protein
MVNSKISWTISKFYGQFRKFMPISLLRIWTDEDLLDVDDIGKASGFPLPFYLLDDELSKSNETDNISTIIESVATVNFPLFY